MADATWCCTVAASDGVGEAGGSLLHGYCCAIYLASTKVAMGPLRQTGIIIPSPLAGPSQISADGTVAFTDFAEPDLKGRHGAEEGGLDAKASGLTVYREALHRGRSPQDATP